MSNSKCRNSDFSKWLIIENTKAGFADSFNVERSSTQNHKADVGNSKINNSDYVAAKTKKPMVYDLSAHGRMAGDGGLKS